VRFWGGARDRTVVSRPVASLVALGLVVGAVVLSGLLALPAVLLSFVLPMGVATAFLIASGEAAYPIAGYVFSRLRRQAVGFPSWAAPDTRGWSLVVVGTLVTVGFNRLVFGLGRLVGIDPVATVNPPDALTLAGLVVVAPVLLFVVGPAEEYLFRGVVQSYLDGPFSTAGAVVVASILFTLVHVPNALFVFPSALLVSGPVWFGVSLAFGWLYERTDTLVVPALVHGLYDVVVFTLVFAEWGLV
jgi:membrane protease YdiL (CAAX protease family)